MLQTLGSTLDQVKQDMKRENDGAKEVGVDLVYESMAKCQKLAESNWTMGSMEADEEPKTEKEQN